MSNVWLAHHGINGQRWGVRRFQNPDGSLTSAGRKRYLQGDGRKHTKEMPGEDHPSTRHDTVNGAPVPRKKFKDAIEKYNFRYGSTLEEKKNEWSKREERYSPNNPDRIKNFKEDYPDRVKTMTPKEIKEDADGAHEYFKEQREWAESERGRTLAKVNEFKKARSEKLTNRLEEAAGNHKVKWDVHMKTANAKEIANNIKGGSGISREDKAHLSMYWKKAEKIYNDILDGDGHADPKKMDEAKRYIRKYFDSCEKISNKLTKDYANKPLIQTKNLTIEYKDVVEQMIRNETMNDYVYDLYKFMEGID